ncbi:VPLPA-CTERM sorting domain-containing protein [uncultured Roseibium sp.]|uniref:VPLPA-CTERM sorting domain-containing protein n=1 Tax=uncultured Roseibium sp. TaxID=1936171 RepID=UPI00262A15D8|nr:VPLPA-CTERM sorting domain-containing protein [uncultured Roseibium sp.]
MRIFKRSMAGVFVIAIVSALFGFASGPAQAVPMSCSSAATYTLGDSTSAACFSGNDTNQIDGSFPLFGMTGWVLADKNDDTASGDGTIKFVTGPTNGAKNGTWSIDTLAGLTNVVITLKAGNGFGAFLLDLTVPDPLSGIWSSSKGLSHASIYYNGTPTTVPLPAGAVLLISGLAGIGLLTSRRRKKT